MEASEAEVLAEVVLEEVGRLYWKKIFENTQYLGFKDVISAYTFE